MSIASEISRISNNVQNTIDAIEAAGVDVPDVANSDNLPSLAQALANTKQDKLTGVEGQVVGFDADGNAVAQDPPDGLPEGGTPGQILSKTETGQEWVDKPVMYVNVTESDGTYSSNKTFEEIQAAYNAGYAIFAITPDIYAGTGSVIVPFFGLNQASAQFYAFSPNYAICYITMIYSAASGGYVLCAISSIDADNIKFTPASGLTADNVQDAIEEVNEKIPSAPKSVAVTLSSTGWSSNTQTVTVQGVKTSGQSVRISPATKTDADNWVSAGVWCSEPTTANQLVFTCDTAPTENININVELQEVQS